MPENELDTYPLGVCLWPAPRANAARTVQQPAYAQEILQHAGLCYREVSPDELERSLSSLRILLTVGEVNPSTALREQLDAWVRAGGAWISVGGICEMPDLFGVAVEIPTTAGWGISASTLGEGYLQPLSFTHSVLSHLRVPLHFFNGVGVTATTAESLAVVLDAHQRPTSRAALTGKATEGGYCLLIAPDVTGTVVRVQQGIAIACDGVPAPDGTAAVCDEVLKSDDGCVLDWEFDRQPVEGVSGLRGFLEPVADLWRELLLRAIFHLAERQRIALPLLWLYPRDLPALAHLSHDTDLNDVERAGILLETLRDADIRSTWCTILPGYPPEIIAAIRDAGHELAMHYDALEHPWSEEEFDAQWRGLTALFGGKRPVTNKNHYLRWEGYTEFYDWCAHRGIQFEQSKGVSKIGEAGFLFGTCHPHFPVARDGRVIDVLELPTPTQDLHAFAPVPVLFALLNAVRRHHGVLHLLFHPGHLDKPEVRDALALAVEAARQHGMEWWTAERINAWERARRQAEWQSYRQSGDSTAVRLKLGAVQDAVTVLWLTPGAGTTSVITSINGEVVPSQSVERWGFPFQAVVFDAGPGDVYRLGWEIEAPA